ncbi:MAG: helix-turn-helix transcriptional regulator, partial [Clostridia bacterium]|nr:helix-turn-helix transcriptional regulator [Clostridia bacterium]
MSTISRRIGNNIRIYRRANRMTLDELADRIHKSKATVGKYEQGAISIDVDTLFDVAAALKIAPSLLLTDPVPEKQ